MKELLPGTHDKAAAEEVFLDIFKTADSKAKGKLIKPFLRGFRYGYRKFKRVNTLKSWEATLRVIGTAKTSTTQEDNAYYLGVALGSFLIGIERYIEDRGSFADRYTEESIILFQLAAQIATQLKALNKSVKPKFIKNRILVIARKNAGSLTTERQKFLARVASLFT